MSTEITRENVDEKIKHFEAGEFAHASDVVAALAKCRELMDEQNARRDSLAQEILETFRVHGIKCIPKDAADPIPAIARVLSHNARLEDEVTALECAVAIRTPPADAKGDG